MIAPEKCITPRLKISAGTQEGGAVKRHVAMKLSDEQQTS